MPFVFPFVFLFVPDMLIRPPPYFPSVLPSDKLVDIMLTSIFEIPGYLKVSLLRTLVLKYRNLVMTWRSALEVRSMPVVLTLFGHGMVRPYPLLFTLSQFSSSQVKEGSEVAILINNLGATTPMELQIIAKQVITNLNNRGLRPVRLLQGSYMTSLDMAGVSISIMDMSNKELLKLVDATTLAPAWGKLYDCSQPENAAIPAPDLGACAASTDGEGAKDDKIKEMIKRAAQALIEAEAELTDWDK